MPVDKYDVDIKINAKKIYSPVIKRTQFPLTLSWTCIVHEKQGLTRDQIIVILTLLRQNCFSYGQVHVALSRVRSFNGLFLVGKFSQKLVRADSSVNLECHRMRNVNQLHNISNSNDALNVCSISVFNTRSLNKHTKDRANDSRITTSDIFCLTER